MEYHWYIILIIYILINTHQKAMSSIFVSNLVLANHWSERWFLIDKNDTSNQKPQRCVSFDQNFRLLLQLAAPLCTHSTRKVLLKEFFSLKKLKTFRKWSGILSFVSLLIKKTVESRRNNSGKGKTERDASFCCAFCWSYFSFHLSLSLY